MIPKRDQEVYPALHLQDKRNREPYCVHFPTKTHYLPTQNSYNEFKMVKFAMQLIVYDFIGP